MEDISIEKQEAIVVPHQIGIFQTIQREYDSFVTLIEDRLSQEVLIVKALENKSAFWFLILSIDVVLRGISQVFLCNDPITGIFICIGLALSSGTLLGYALLGTTLGTFSAATIARPPTPDVLAGLCGYDGALVGCACFAFLDPSCAMGAAILLSLLSGILHVAVENVMKAWQLPCFTFSFNICLILFLYAASHNVITLNLSSKPPVIHSKDFEDMSIMFAVDATFRGVGQFMFVDTTVGGAFVVAGIAWSSKKGALIATTGSIIGWITSFYILKVANIVNIRTGLTGYNSAGSCTAIAGGIFYNTSDSAVLLGFIGAMLASLFNVGFAGMFGGLPVLTFPFIVSTWLIMLSRTKWHKENDGYFGTVWVKSTTRDTWRIPFIDYNPFESDDSLDDDISGSNSADIENLLGNNSDASGSIADDLGRVSGHGSRSVDHEVFPPTTVPLSGNAGYLPPVFNVKRLPTDLVASDSSLNISIHARRPKPKAARVAGSKLDASLSSSSSSRADRRSANSNSASGALDFSNSSASSRAARQALLMQREAAARRAAVLAARSVLSGGDDDDEIGFNASNKDNSSGINSEFGIEGDTNLSSNIQDDQ